MTPLAAPAALTALFNLSGKQAGMLVAAIAIFLAGFGSAWKIQGWRADARRTQEAEARVEVAHKQADVSLKEGKRQIEVQTKIQTVFVEREREITRNEDAAREANANCVVPNRTKRLWDSANQMRDADPAAVADLSPSGALLTDVERQHDREARICHLWIERAKGLQRWYSEQVEASK